MTLSRQLILCALALLTASIAASVAAAPAPVPSPQSTRSVSFATLGAGREFSLPAGITREFNVGLREDELVARARLHLRYQYSPALIPVQSRIKVLLNDETLGVLPVEKGGAGRPQVVELDIDPRLILDNNRLGFQLIGHYSTGCEEPSHDSMWVAVSGNSTLELSTTRLALASTLARLPTPFFDRADPNRLALPFVFAARSSRASVRAAGVVASWFGQLAGWRGARFPVRRDAPPTGHAVVFATDGERPAFMGQLPAVTGPSISVITNPADGVSKLLLVQGRDGAELKVAADALVLPRLPFSGAQYRPASAPVAAPRQPYDAPRWVRMDRPVRFAELIEYPGQLTSAQNGVEPVRVNLRIAPDIHGGEDALVPMVLQARHAALVPGAQGWLEVGANAMMLDVLTLVPLVPRADTLPAEPFQRVSDVSTIPIHKLGPRSQLQFGFHLRPGRVGACRDARSVPVRAGIGGESTLDFSGFTHYAQMPELAHFVALGFPFTRYADLSETVIVLPESPADTDLEAMFAVLGRMGEATGYPTTGVQLADASDSAALAERDILLIGAEPAQKLLALWSRSLPTALSGEFARTGQPARGGRPMFHWLNRRGDGDAALVTTQATRSQGLIGALFGFESPLTAQRSVVAITAVSADALALTLDAMDDPVRAGAMYGSAVFIHPNKVDSVLVGPTYTVGTPLWRSRVSAFFAKVVHMARVLPGLVWSASALTPFALLVALVLFVAMFRTGRRTLGAGHRVPEA